MKSERDFLEDILTECDYLVAVGANTNLETFLGDETTKRAFTRSLEIIGEAVKRMPSNLVACHPEVPWKRMAGMRDRLIHGYFAVDYSLVWDVVMHHVPPLRAGIMALLKQ